MELFPDGLGNGNAMTIEAMKLALEFIEATNKSSSFWLVPESNLNKTATALRTAIEQAEKQEPVAYLCENAVGHRYFRWKKPISTYKPIALYTTPQPKREWVSLTDAEIEEFDYYARDLVMDIEKALKERNA